MDEDLPPAASRKKEPLRDDFTSLTVVAVAVKEVGRVYTRIAYC